MDLTNAEASARAWLQARIAAHLNVEIDQLDLDAPFTRFGIDSVEALAITVEIEDHLGIRLPTTAVWDHPTIAKLARFIGGGTGTAAVEKPTSSNAMRSEIDPRTHDIARFDESRNLRLRLRLAQVQTIGNPYFKMSTNVSSDIIEIGEREYINYGTYNYLGLSGHPRLVDAGTAAARQFGTSSSASRTTSGEKPVHRALEKRIAQLLQVDDAVCYVGGHSTNVSFIGEFLDVDDLLLHDELAHDSILQGAKLSGAARVPFRHNSASAVEEFLRERRGRYRRVLIAVEGVYSTDGDIAPLRELIDIKRRYGAMLMVDEAHSIGVLGARGGGIREHAGVAGSDVDIWMGTLSKAFASCGGYIAGSRTLVELVKYTSPGFIYSVGMTPFNAGAALEAIRVMQESPERVSRLHSNANLFRDECKRLGLDTGLSNDSPVVPVLVGDTLQCMRLAQSLFARGINVTPMVHPAVRNDAARLRFFVSAQHSEEQLKYTAQATLEEFEKIREQYAGNFARLRSAPLIEPREAAIAREGFEGFTKGDLSILADQLHENAVYFFPGTSAVAGYHENRDAILDFFASIFELTDGTLSVHLESILSAPGTGVLIWRNVAERDGFRLENSMCEILDIQEESVVSATFYSVDQPTLDRFLAVADSAPAMPRRHMRAANHLSPDIAGLANQLLTSDPIEYDIETRLAPGLLKSGAVMESTLSYAREKLRELSAEGYAFEVDLAVAAEDYGVARFQVKRGSDFFGSVCLVIEKKDGRPFKAWLGADRPFYSNNL